MYIGMLYNNGQRVLNTFGRTSRQTIRSSVTDMAPDRTGEIMAETTEKKKRK